MLFSSDPRTYTSHQNRKFSTFEFLDRSAWSICALLREYLTKWAKDFDNDNEFLRRYQSKDNKQHYAAEFELLLYTLLKKQKFQIEKHPDLGTTKRLDFRIRDLSGSPLLLECTLAGDSFENLSEKNQKSTIAEIIDEIEYHPYFINIIYKTISRESISKNKLLQFLE